MTDWGKNILDSYYEYKYDKCYRRLFCCVCHNPHQKSKFYYPNKYNWNLLKFLTEEKQFKKNLAKQQKNINNNNLEKSNSNIFQNIAEEVTEKIMVTNAFNNIDNDDTEINISDKNLEV
jgi:hypothetical protein